MANTVSNVSVGKPKVAGAIYYAPIDTPTSSLPTDATTVLDKAFVCLGYVSEDGITNSNSPDTETIKAWGGDVVATPLSEKNDTYSFTLIEALNENVLKAVYGADNVSGSLADGLTVKARAEDPIHYVWVFEKVLTGNTKNRTLVYNAPITSVGDITYNDSDAIGYELEITALPNADGETHVDFFKKGE